jgi:hypothetical protein
MTRESSARAALLQRKQCCCCGEEFEERAPSYAVVCEHCVKLYEE